MTVKAETATPVAQAIWELLVELSMSRVRPRFRAGQGFKDVVAGKATAPKLTLGQRVKFRVDGEGDAARVTYVNILTLPDPA